MPSRISIVILGFIAAAALTALSATGVWMLRADTSGAAALPENGSLLHPQIMQDASPDGYVIAELYQDVHLDVASGVYDQDGVLQGRYWSHGAATQTCSIDLTLADQHGRDEIAPTATPRPTHTPRPTDPPPHPEEYSVVERTIDTDHGAGIALVAVPVPRTRWPTSTPRPTYTPFPTATPRVMAAADWNHWKGRPLAIEADGLAVVDVPRDTVVSAYLSLRTGPNSGHNSHTELARMPLPDAVWSMGSAYVSLPDASGRILLESDAIDATYRSAVLHLEISPLTDCSGLKLRWQRSAAVVLTALTDNPFTDWVGRAAPPPTPMPGNVAIYAAVHQDMTSPFRFVPADFLGSTAGVPASTSTVAGHIVIPTAPDPAEDYYVGFAVRSSLIPNGLSDIRQSGSAFDAFDAFDASPSGMTINIGGDDFTLYQSEQRWRGNLLGGEWSLTP